MGKNVVSENFMKMNMTGISSREKSAAKKRSLLKLSLLIDNRKKGKKINT